MADQRKEFDPMQPNISGGEQGSEHEWEVAGMAQATSKGSAQPDKDRAAEGSLENLRSKRIERGEDPDAPVTRAATSSWTEGDERALGDSREGSGKDRTPQEMSFHDELSRQPDKDSQEGHATKGTGRSGA